ncbi:MAG: hypothetical protein V1663_03870 [archaeon]
MRSISNNFLAFLYIVLIISSSIGILLIFTGFERPYTVGNAEAQVGVCVVIMPTMEDILDLIAPVGQEFDYYVIAHDDNGVIFTDNTTLFNISYYSSESNDFIGLISFTPVLGDIGSYIVRIYVNDSICKDAMVYDDFLLNIIAGAPVLDYIPPLTAIEDILFSYDVNATDPNNSPLTFNSNESWFLINTTTGIISFTPTNDHVGFHYINITVNNTYNIKDSQIVNFTVINVNDAPVLDYIPNFYIYEDAAFYYEVNATDIDLNIPNSNEVLYFYDDTNLFVINELTGEISFSPDYDKIGNNMSVIISVSDEETIDYQYVNFTIISVNDAPVMILDTAQTAYVNDTFYSYDVYAYDEEDGNEGSGNLTFWDNTSLFNITSNTGKFNITMDISMVGTYMINISVNDSTGAMTSAIISLTITNENRPPVILSYFPLDLTPEIYETESINFSISAYDPDGTIPSIVWYLDNVNTNITSSAYSYVTGYESSGIHNITVTVSDGVITIALKWDVTVLNKEIVGPTGPSGGGGGGGGRSSVGCSSTWVCTDWSPCTVDDKQIRECNDLRFCNLNRPNEVRDCTYVPIPSCNDGVKNCHDNDCEILIDCGGSCKMCPTCDDNIKNQGELNIDCGGPCPICIEKEKEIEAPLQISIKKMVNWWLFLVLILLLLVIILVIKRKIRKIWVREKEVKEKSIMSKINSLLRTGEKAIKNKDINAAKQIYNKLEYWYNKLDENEKKRIYNNIYGFYKKLGKI